MAQQQPQKVSIIGDLSHVCDNRTEGELVGHPLDCNAYFVCNQIPNVLYCSQGLYFDANRRECDLPEKVNCVTQGGDDNDWPQYKPRPVFMAVDVVSGKPVDPLDKYDPLHIECRHFGAYFLPHPTKCQVYFICAYGHLHRHQCGRGTFWNYKQAECQLSGDALCYNNVLQNQSQWQGQGQQGQQAQEHSDGSQLTTVCYIVSTTSSVYPSEIETTPTVEETGATVSSTDAALQGPPRTETGKAPLTCPLERQSYLSHPDDCAKYYICIVGMPVLTSCPKGLYWDQKSGYCDLAKNVKCFQN
ncbi:uncharacterized protein Dwil_GK12591 [Drosophila willistoni]|uniref:Chitin-binding type-2 domain-containing protein n=2 Tax=Drosophila willistoni TaxID=7260 RepID=B4N2Z2_DROWI|nr:uncharacterized protein Dwil_GK12591 [Drosophila willistoni]